MTEKHQPDSSPLMSDEAAAQEAARILSQTEAGRSLLEEVEVATRHDRLDIPDHTLSGHGEELARRSIMALERTYGLTPEEANPDLSRPE